MPLQFLLEKNKWAKLSLKNKLQIDWKYPLYFGRSCTRATLPLLLQPEAETRYHLPPFIVSASPSAWKIIFIVPYPTQEMKDRVRKDPSSRKPNRVSRAFVSQESWERPRSFFTAEPRDKRRGTGRHETVRGKRITPLPDETRVPAACGGSSRSYVFHVIFAMHLHGKHARFPRGSTPVIRIINSVMSPCWHVKFPRALRFVNSGARLEASVDRHPEKILYRGLPWHLCCRTTGEILTLNAATIVLKMKLTQFLPWLR